MSSQTCPVCFHHCQLRPGQRGICMARVNEDGAIRPANYGKITALALDPIEKKPLARFYPGSRILSIGSFGCNLKCPFCQNSEISYAVEDGKGKLLYFGPEGDVFSIPYQTLSPDELCKQALALQSQGNIGLAYTYNEPLVGWEFVRDTARLVHEAGMKNVMVTNGTAELAILDQLAPYIDAMNIDLKAFQAETYEQVLKGSLAMTRAFIERAATLCHVEITCLVVPGMNDGEEEIRQMASWLASLKSGAGHETPLHLTRFFSAFQMRDRAATPRETMYRLKEVAEEQLDFVYLGNM